MIQSKSAGRNNAMDVRMMLQILAPRMKNAEEPNFGAEMFRVGCDLQQCLRTCVEQEVVNNSLVLHCQCRQFVRQREYDVEVGNGQQISRLLCYPFLAGAGLTFRTVPVSA